MADRIETHHALRPQRAIEQIGRDVSRRRRLRQLVPAEVPRHQLIGLEHALARADGRDAGVEGELQSPLRGLSALPEMLLLGEHVVLDVADRQRTGAQEPHHLARIGRLDRGVPFVPLAPVLAHRRQEEAKIVRRHIGQRMGPVFEHALVDTLRLAQVRAGVGRDTAIENVMMAALDDVDGVDLDVAEMGDHGRHRRRAVAEWRRRVQPLRPQPDMAGFDRA